MEELRRPLQVHSDSTIIVCFVFTFSLVLLANISIPLVSAAQNKPTLPGFHVVLFFKINWYFNAVSLCRYCIINTQRAPVQTVSL